MNPAPDIGEIVQRMKAEGGAFAVATVVRTLSVTAAKPGAKALISQQGEIIEGWIGGGCARSAVIKAAVASITEGEPRLLSVQPEEVLNRQGVGAGARVGDAVDGRWLASNLCPSKGSMEVFIEPFLSNPELIVAGGSPVAATICQLAALFGFSVSTVGSGVDAKLATLSIHHPQWEDVPVEHAHRYIVLATQGAGDLPALKGALSVQSRHVGFVGSHRKMAYLRSQLEDASFSAAEVARIKGPAGLDIGSVTPHEIALSILAELVQIRRTDTAGSATAQTNSN